MNQEADLLQAVAELIEAYFSGLRRTGRKNLARLTGAFLRLALSVRFGYGGLHWTSVARVLPEGRKFKSSYKWLGRFLQCKYFDPSSLAECMLALILGEKPPPWVIVLVDQTTVDGVQVINAALPFQGRAVPVAWVDFEYPWKTLAPPSRNTVARYLLTWLGLATPPGVGLILVFDRGYARVELIRDLNHGRQPFLIRARSKVIVQAEVRGRRQRLSLGRCPTAAVAPPAIATSSTIARRPNLSMSSSTGRGGSSHLGFSSSPLTRKLGCPPSRSSNSIASACKSRTASATGKAILACGAYTSRCTSRNAYSAC
jgi:hypothetical protein